MSLLFIGWSNFWILFVIGFACVLPVATQVTYWYETRAGDRNRDQNTSENSDQHGALETLRERYASGDIDEREFERRVERLVKTESVADAETAYRNTDRSSDEPSRQVERDY
ncbi:SHOCT domain-containing protein [Natronobacterium texcoconense]|nr:SHOCT domain-containing protein [Natronobacterium texcoconense]